LGLGSFGGKRRWVELANQGLTGTGISVSETLFLPSDIQTLMGGCGEVNGDFLAKNEGRKKKKGTLTRMGR